MPRESFLGMENQNVQLPASTFRFEFTASPQLDYMDGVVGLAAGSSSEYIDLAVNVRFNPNGFIDARSGSIYAPSNFPYSQNETYRFTFDVDLLAHTYSVAVTTSTGTVQSLWNELVLSSRAIPSEFADDGQYLFERR